MVQKYQNEIAPIFYYGIIRKTNEKYPKIPNLQPPDWKSPYWMNLYIEFEIYICDICVCSIFCYIYGMFCWMLETAAHFQNKLKNWNTHHQLWINEKYNLVSDNLHEWTSFFGFHPQCPVFHQDQCQRCLETQSENKWYY